MGARAASDASDGSIEAHPIAFASTDLHEEPRSVLGKGLEFRSHTSLSMGSRALTETREKVPGEYSPKV